MHTSSNLLARCAIGLVAMLGLLTAPKPAMASYGGEQEPNGTITQANNIDHLFSSEFDPYIAFSEQFAHASIRGRGVATRLGNNFDFFSFNVDRPGGRGIFDIDLTRSFANVSSSCRGPIDHCPVDSTDRGFDTRLFLYDSTFTSVAFPSDDEFATLGALGSVANSPLGSGLSLDPFLDYVFQSAGTHYIGVQFVALDGYRQQRGDYTLHVSLQPVPEPTTMMGLLGVGALGLMVKRRRSAAA
jgi:PEP-CTERM motif